MNSLRSAGSVARLSPLSLLLLCWPLLADPLVVQPGDTLRGLAAQHLGDAELWPELLQANDLASVAELRPGMELRLPAAEIVTTQQLLVAVQETIQQANRLRARLFAPREIHAAVSLRDQALELRRQRRWKEALQQIQEAERMADEALRICEEKRNVTAEAQLVDRRGGVERRRPRDTAWHNLALHDNVTEGERIRTLADSSAELLFRDASRLRMDANSQLVIQEMRSNLLESRQQAKVSLVSGDLYAVLGGNPQRDSFDLDIPGIRLAGSSQDFYVSREEEGTKLANYQGELEVESGAARVTLAENEGVAVDGEGISGKRDLLPLVRGLEPPDREVFYQDRPQVQWQAVEGADHYLVELAADAAFNRLLQSHKVTASEVTLRALEEGSYFWRVAAVDAEGFPGPRSLGRGLQVVFDTQPPYLALYHPAEGAVIMLSPLRVSGTVEPGAQLQIAGELITPDESGNFSWTLLPQEGENQLDLVATDAAGNRTELTRGYRYQPEPELFVELDEGLARDPDGELVALVDGGHLRGRTLPHGRVEMRLEDGRRLASVAADANGQFSLTLPAAQELWSFSLNLTSVAGQQLQRALTIRRVESLPALFFDPEPPVRSAQPQLQLGGRVAGVALWLGGEPVPLQQGTFQIDYPLQEGVNQLVLRVADHYGHQREIRRWVVRDQQPPTVRRSTIRSQQVGGRTQLEILVTAEDESPLRATAPYTLHAGEFSYSGWLRLDGDGLRYRGLVELPVQGRLRPVRAEVEVSDLLGNRRSVRVE